MNRTPASEVGGESVTTLPPWPQSTSRRSPPFFQRRLANKEMLKQCVKLYYQWLHSSTKPNLARVPVIKSGYKALQKDLALASCIQSLLSKNAIERVEKGVLSLGFYSQLFLVPKPHQRWRPLIDLSRLNPFLLVERSISASLIPGEWVASIDLLDTYFHLPIHPNSRKYQQFCHNSQVFQFTFLPFGLAMAPPVFTMIVKDVKLMALSSGVTKTSPISGRLADQGLIPTGDRCEHPDSGRLNTILGVDNKQSLN